MCGLEAGELSCAFAAPYTLIYDTVVRPDRWPLGTLLAFITWDRRELMLKIDYSLFENIILSHDSHSNGTKVIIMFSRYYSPYRSLHTVFPIWCSTSRAPHTLFPIQCSPYGAPHAGLPTHCSPYSAPHMVLPIQGSPTQCSLYSAPHAGLPIHGPQPLCSLH